MGPVTLHAARSEVAKIDSAPGFRTRLSLLPVVGGTVHGLQRYAFSLRLAADRGRRSKFQESHRS